MQFGLKRIMLVDSYVEGRVAELDVSGHTNISGENGKGKTSFLKLIPIFNGEKPGNLTTASTGGNLSFNDFYLPRIGSHIVFEYLNQGEPRMVVFCNLANDARHRHLFIDSAFRMDLFINPETEEIYPASTLRQRVIRLGLDHKVVDTTKDYRKILLDGTTPGAYQFCLGPKSSRMGGLSPLFTAMLKRDVKFSHFQEMVQEYALAKIDDEGRKILEGYKTHRGHYIDTLRHYDAYRELESSREKLEELETQLDTNKRTFRTRSAIIVAARELVTQLEIEVDELSLAISNANEEIHQGEIARDNQIEAIEAEEETLREERGPLKSQLDTIIKRKKWFEEQDIPGWQARLNGIAELEGRRETLQGQLTLLENQSEEIRAPIEAQMQARRDQHQTTLNRIGQETRHISQRHETDLEALNKALKTTRDALDERHKAESDDYQNSVIPVQSRLSVLKEREKNPPIPENLLRQKELAEAQAQADEELRHKAQLAFDEADGYFETAKKRYEQLNTAFLKARDDFDQLDDQRSKLVNLLNSGEATLIYFLNQNKPGWEASLGRILSDDILLKKNLSPSVAEHAADDESVCGITLDFEKLPDRELSKDQLEAQLEELDADVAEANAKLDKAETELEKANSNRQQRESARDKAKRQLTAARAKVQESSKQLKNIREDIAEAKKHAAKDVQEQIAQCEQELANLESQKKDMDSRHRQEKQSTENDGDTQVQALKETRNKAEKELQHQAKNSERTLNSDLRALGGQLNRALQGKNISPDEIERLRGTVGELKAETSAIREKESLIRSYERFLEEEYASKDALEADVRSRDQALTNKAEEKRTLLEQWKKTLKELQGDIQQKTRDKTRLESEGLSIKTGIVDRTADDSAMISEGDTAFAIFKQMRASKLLNEFHDTEKALARTLTEIRKLGEQFASIFEKYTQTPAAQYWQETMGHWDGSDHKSIERGRAIIAYFRGGSHDVFYKTIVQGFNSLDQVDTYRRAMEQVERRVKHFNTELAANTSSNLKFNSIESIEPSISFDLDKLDYWKDIEHLANHVRNWRETSNLEDMPDKELIEALRNYIETFDEARTSVPVNELWRLIHFRFRVVENGHTKTINSPRELAEVSSNGLSYLIMIVVFLGFIAIQRKDKPVHLSWALDELRAFDAGNRALLLDLLGQHRINLITACPEMDHSELSLFNRHYEIAGDRGDIRFVQWVPPEENMSGHNNPFRDTSDKSIEAPGETV
jgi:DNA repair exonuclease SbcCD ATPase subunit